MEIQQNENKTLATYINHFKMEAMRCDFDNDNVPVCIFVKGLGDACNVAEKVYEKDPRLYLKLLNWWRK